MQRNHQQNGKQYHSRKGNHHSRSKAHVTDVNQHRKYQGQQQAKNQSDEQFKLLLNLVLNSNLDFTNTSLTLLFITALGAVAANEYNLQNQVYSKTIVEGNASPDECQTIQDEIIKTINMKGFDNEYIKYVLAQDDFHIKCTKNEKYFKFINGAPTSLASFTLTTQSIQFYPHYISEHESRRTLRHEFTHAYNFFYHKNGKCKGSDVEMVTPVFPRNSVEIKRYHAAFDKGDARIRRYIKLSGKAENGQLSGKEKLIYDKYSNVFADCLPINALATDKSLHESTLIGTFPSLSCRVLNALFYLHPMGNTGEKIIHVRHENNRFIFLTQTTDNHSFAKALLRGIENAINMYKSSTDFILIEEREANTFESLTTDAQKIIYPEAYALRKEYLARCASTTESSEPEKSMRVEL